MALEQFGNQAQTTLSAGVNASTTTLPVTDNGAPPFTFPSSAQFRVRVDDEIMLVTAGAGTTSWTVTRGAEGTTAASHSSGARVYGVLTATALAAMQQTRDIGSQDGTVYPVKVFGMGAINPAVDTGNFVERGVKIRAVSPVDGSLYAADAYTQNVLRSTDDGLTWTVLGTPTSAGQTVAQVEEILVLRSGTILACVRLSSPNQARVIVRSADSGATWARVFSFPFIDANNPIEKLLHAQSWLQRSSGVSNDVFFGEYGDATATNMRLMRSTDDGQTFTAAFTWTDIRHIHSVYEDPYNTGRLWTTIGDTLLQPRIGYSDNNGASWTMITQGDGSSTADSAYQRSRAIGLMFTAAAVFWISDVPGFPANIYRYDRSVTPNPATGAGITVVARNLSGTFYGAMTVKPSAGGAPYRDGLLAAFSNQEPSSSWAVGKDEYVRAVVSADGGVTWRTVFRWRRDQTNQNASPPWVVHRPGDDFCWVSWNNLEDMPGNSDSVNVKFQGAPVFQGEQQEIDGHAAMLAAMPVRPREMTSQENTGNTGIAVSGQRPWFIAPYDLEGTLNIAVALAIPQGDASNNWQVYVDIYRAGVQKDNFGPILNSNGAAVAAYTAGAGGKIRMKQGDVARVRLVKTGAPGANIVHPAVVAEVRRIVGTLVA